jgi:hypothetical protein
MPLRRFIGDMSQTEKILLGLDVRPKPSFRAEEAMKIGSTPSTLSARHESQEAPTAREGLRRWSRAFARPVG